VADATHARKRASCDGVESLGEWHPDASGKSRVNGKNEGTLYATVVFSAPGKSLTGQGVFARLAQSWGKPTNHQPTPIEASHSQQGGRKNSACRLTQTGR
jgi:hypothetical protein